MKTKVCAIAALVLTLTPASEILAQEQAPGVGVGLGIGVGVGVGLAGNIQVLRVPGNVVQGRRVFVARFIASSTTSSSSSGVAGPLGAPAGDGSGGLTSACSSSSIDASTSISTDINVFNPNTNAVSFTIKAASAGIASTNAQSITLLPCRETGIDVNTIRALLGLPGPFPGAYSAGFVMIESRSPLEVAATYSYTARESQVESQRELHEECFCNTKHHECPPR